MIGLVCFMCRWRQTHPIYATVFTTFSMGCVNFATLMPTPSSARSGTLHSYSCIRSIVQFFSWSEVHRIWLFGVNLLYSICVLKVCDAQTQTRTAVESCSRHKHALCWVMWCSNTNMHCVESCSAQTQTRTAVESYSAQTQTHTAVESCDAQT